MDKYDILGFVVTGIILIACFYIYFSNYRSFDLKCIISTVDGNEYCVRERTRVQEAADLLAKVTDKCKRLVRYVYEKFPDQANVQRLYSGFNPEKVMETLPTSKFTAYSENKGEKIAFCLNKVKQDNEVLIDENTLTFVAIHEISHVMTKSVGHKSEFWENFKFMLEQAKEAGIHNPVDYKKEPREYCGMKIHDNPYYDA